MVVIGEASYLFEKENDKDRLSYFFRDALILSEEWTDEDKSRLYTQILENLKEVFEEDDHSFFMEKLFDLQNQLPVILRGGPLIRLAMQIEYFSSMKQLLWIEKIGKTLPAVKGKIAEEDLNAINHFLRNNLRTLILSFVKLIILLNIFKLARPKTIPSSLELLELEGALSR